MTWEWQGILIVLLLLVFIGLIVYLILKSIKPTPIEVSHKENIALEILRKKVCQGRD